MSWRETIKGMTPRQIVRAAFRKYVFRSVRMGLYEVRLNALRRTAPDGFTFLCLPASDIDFQEFENPFLSKTDVSELQSHPNAMCVLAIHNGEVAGSLWAFQHSVAVTELGITLPLLDNERYISRAFVSERYRGRSLLTHMLDYYLHLLPPGARVVALIYDWNAPSIRSFAASGFERTSTLWAAWALGRHFSGKRKTKPASRGKGVREECLILAGENAGSALHAARQLGRRGVNVYVAAPKGWGRILRASRYCRAVREFDTCDAEKYCREVAAWAKATVRGNETVPVTPLSDRLVDHVSHHRGVFDPVFRIGIPGAEVVDLLVSKSTSLAAAERAGLDVPSWCVVSERDDLADANRLRLPVIVKPTSWATGGSHPFKLRVVRDAADLDRLLHETVTQGAAVVVQEYLPAEDGSVVFGLTWRSLSGDQTVVCTGRKERQASTDGGIMAWGMADDDPGVRSLAERFLDESGFVGLGGIEFIRDGSMHWFIEFNPRPEAIHFLAEAAGQPMVWWLYQDLKGRSVEVAPQAPAGAWVGPAWLERVRRDPRDVALWWRDRVAFSRVPGAVFSVWDPRDPGPSVVFVQRLVSAGARSVTRRVWRQKSEGTT